MNEFNLTDNVNTLFQSLEDFTQKEGVIGKPVSLEEKTLMPVVSLTVGYGGGNASLGIGKGHPQQGAQGQGNSGPGALGLGAKLSTDAVIVIDGQNISVLPLNGMGMGQQLVEKIPQMISGMSPVKQRVQPAGHVRPAAAAQPANQQQEQRPYQQWPGDGARQ